MLDRISALPPAVLLGIAALFTVVLSIVGLRGECVTTDELVHLPSGYTYLTTGDFRMNPEHPALAKMVAALPLLALSPRWPATDHWAKGDEWGFGYHFYYDDGNDPRRILFWGRLSMLFWSVLLLGSIYATTRELFGRRGALIALALAAASPMALGHGHLVNTDVPVSCLLLLAVAAVWQLTRTPGWRWCLYSGAALGGAISVKYSAVMLAPAVILTAVLSQHVGVRPAEAEGSRRRLLRLLGFVAAAGVLAWAIVWAVYGFRYRAAPAGDFQFSWSQEYLTGTVLGRCINLARRVHFLPEAWLSGFSYMHHSTQARYAFAFGQYSDQGWWWYFPAGFLVKTPAATLLLMGWGLWASGRRYRSGDARDFFLVIPLILYWVLAMNSNINIGIRHILPAVPLMTVLAGGIEYPGAAVLLGRRTAQLVLALLLTAFAGCLTAAPHFLAYFNAPSLLFAERHEMLVDSNLDWGQDLYRLKAYMDRNGIRKIKMAYFGNGSPRRAGLDHESLPGAHIYTFYEPEWKHAHGVRAGEYVAISATNLVGVLFIDDRFYYQRKFASMTPVARIGHSILVYRMDRDWP